MAGLLDLFSNSQQPDEGQLLGGTAGTGSGLPSFSSNLLPYLYLAAAAGQSSAPSRLPVTNGMVLGNMLGGLAQGIGASSQQRLQSQQAESAALQNKMTLQRFGVLSNLLRQHNLLGGSDTGAAAPGSAGAGGYGNGMLLGSAQGTVPTAGADNSAPTRGDSGAAGTLPTGSGGQVGNSGYASPLIGASSSTTPGQDQSGTDLLGQSMVADMLSPTYAKIFAAQHPGPTDFQRAYQDYVGAPPQLKALAAQKLVTAAGDRYQLMRNGWAYDRVSQQWMHMPSLGEGVTGTMGPDGTMSAHVVPGAPAAAQTMSTAEATGPANFRPTTVYGQNGQEYQTTAANLPGILAAGGAGTPPPQGASGLTNPNNPPSVFNPPAGSPAAAPQAPSSGGPQQGAAGARGATGPLSGVPIPVQTPSGPKDITQLSLGDLFPGGQGIPQPPAPPQGAGFGPPNQATVDRQKNDAELLSTYTKNASENQKIYQDLGHLQDALQRAQTGKLSPAWADMTNVAQDLGLNAYIPANRDPNDAAMFNKAATDLVFASVKKLAGQVKVAEIEGYKQASPGLSLPPDANYSIINDILAAGRVQDTQAKLANDYWNTTGGAPLSAFNDKFNQMVPLDTISDHLRQTFRAAGAKFPGDPGTPSNPVPASAFASDAKAQTVKRNYLGGMYGKVGSPEAKAAAEQAYGVLGQQ